MTSNLQTGGLGWSLPMALSSLPLCGQMIEHILYTFVWMCVCVPGRIRLQRLLMVAGSARPQGHRNHKPQYIPNPVWTLGRRYIVVSQIVARSTSATHTLLYAKIKI